MHQLTIHKLGPIKHCELSTKQFTVLTGYQASGKSTIAKAIYFFRTLKDDLYHLIQKNYFTQSANRIVDPEYRLESAKNRDGLLGDFNNCVRTKFLNTFGTSYSMDSAMKLNYQYSEDVSITISLRKGQDSLAPNFVEVTYSEKLRKFLKACGGGRNPKLFDLDIKQVFNDYYETVYIPAGRSILTVLGSQFNYFYSTMDDAQKSLLDSCTRDYLERVMRLRPQFANGLEGLLEGQDHLSDKRKLYKMALDLIGRILKGKYTVSDGEERIWVDSKHYVKINFASSGQQEVVWIVNLLFYYLALNEKIFFIIEEPESNLFPESQKLIVELISLVANAGNSVLITTHSPYVLGAVNNMLYAETVGELWKEKADKIISSVKWIEHQNFDAFFVENGKVTPCIDQALMQIDNSLLDQISHIINEEYDDLFEIEQNIEGGH